MKSRDAWLVGLFVAGAAMACSDASQFMPLTAPDAGAESSTSVADQPRSQEVPPRSRRKKENFVGMPTDSLWDLVAAAGGDVIVGLKPPGERRGTYRGVNLTDDGQRQSAIRSVIGQQGITLIEENPRLPSIRVHVVDEESLIRLRRLQVVDYLEPAILRGAYQLNIGCDIETASANRWGYSGAYGVTDLLPITYPLMAIPEAWKRSTGRGKTVGLTDTGIFLSSQQMVAGYNAGESTGRTFVTMSSLSDGNGLISDLGCSHGPRMAGVIGAPRDGQGPIGVAYGANMVNVRVNEDIFHFDVGAAVNGIASAAMNGSNIIVIAWGSTDFWSNSLEDEINYWHNQNRLFVAAAGTTPGCWPYEARQNTIFPAEMSVVIAVTALNDDGTLACNAMHGPAVDLGAHVNQPSTGRNTEVLSLMGSSNAAAVVGGVAALIWSRYPGMTNAQVRQRLEGHVRWTASGYGAPNAYTAVGGFGWLELHAQDCAIRRYESTVAAAAVPKGDGPFKYRWSNGDTTATAEYVIPPVGTAVEISVEVTDIIENRLHWASKRVPIVSHLSPCE